MSPPPPSWPRNSSPMGSAARNAMLQRESRPLPLVLAAVPLPARATALQPRQQLIPTRADPKSARAGRVVSELTVSTVVLPAPQRNVRAAPRRATYCIGGTVPANSTSCIGHDLHPRQRGRLDDPLVPTLSKPPPPVREAPCASVLLLASTTSFVICMKAASTLAIVLADTSKNLALCVAASVAPSCRLTARLASRSTLFPTNTLTTLADARRSIWQRRRAKSIKAA